MQKSQSKELEDIIRNTANMSIVEEFKYINFKYGNQAVFSSSLGIEDQVITDIIYSNNFNIEVFTIDTLRLFKESHDLIQSVNHKYQKKITEYFPDSKKVQNMVENKGEFSFYQSLINRQECCFIRKVEPLIQALKGKKVWITGLRAEQSQIRLNLKKIEFNQEYNIIKYNPLIKWSFAKAKKYIKKNQVPINILHAKNYPSIGCEPCTRAIKPEENIRAGRWWWEKKSSKECGLHT